MNFDQTIKAVSLLGAICTFAWGVFQYFETNAIKAESNRIEAMKSYLTLQLDLYGDAVKTTATIATTKDPVEKDKATEHFWYLYWGELALVENEGVNNAMWAFGEDLKIGSPNAKVLCLDLARKARNSLADTWKVEAWESPFR